MGRGPRATVRAQPASSSLDRRKQLVIPSFGCFSGGRFMRANSCCVAAPFELAEGLRAGAGCRYPLYGAITRHDRDRVVPGPTTRRPESTGCKTSSDVACRSSISPAYVYSGTDAFQGFFGPNSCNEIRVATPEALDSYGGSQWRRLPEVYENLNPASSDSPNFGSRASPDIRSRSAAPLRTFNGSFSSSARVARRWCSPAHIGRHQKEFTFATLPLFGIDAAEQCLNELHRWDGPMLYLLICWMALPLTYREFDVRRVTLCSFGVDYA